MLLSIEEYFILLKYKGLSKGLLKALLRLNKKYYRISFNKLYFANHYNDVALAFNYRYKKESVRYIEENR